MRNAPAVFYYRFASNYFLQYWSLICLETYPKLDSFWIDPGKQPFLPVYIGEHIHVLFDKLVCTVLFTRNESSSS